MLCKGMEKDFDSWNKVKQDLDEWSKPPFFNEREIWWCSIGVNVGFEIYGKGETFARPVLIVRKYSRHTFFGLPFTSRRKDHPMHYPIDFNNRKGSLLLDQGKTMDSKRLGRMIGSISEKKLNEIVRVFNNSICT